MMVRMSMVLLTWPSMLRIIVDVNASGEVVQLYPNKFTAGEQVARVSPGADLSIPGSNYGFTAFKAIEPTGKGQLIAIVVPDTFPAEALVDTSEQRTRGFAPVSAPTNYLMNLVQQVVSAVGGRGGTDRKLDSWGLGTTEYEIVK